MSDGNIGEFYVGVGADLSDMQRSFSDAVAKAREAGDQIGQAFQRAAQQPVDWSDLVGKAGQAGTDAGAAVSSGLSSGISGAGENAGREIGAGLENAVPAAQQTGQAIADALTQGMSGIDQLKASLDDLRAKFEEMQPAIKEFGQSMLSTGLAISGISVPLVGLGLEAIKTAGWMEQSQVAFTTLLGSAEKAKTFLSALVDFAQRTPFQIGTLVDSSRRLLAMGFDFDKLIPTIRTLGDAVSGLGLGESGLKRLTLAFGEMQTRGTIALKELNQLALAGIPAVEILAEKLGVKVSEIFGMTRTKMIQSVDAIPMLLEGINEKFGGMMQKQSETLLGNWTNVKDNITKTLIAIGNELLPTAKLFIQAFREFLDYVRLIAEAFGRLPEPVKAFVLALGAIVAVMGPLLIAVGAALIALGSLSPTILAIASAAAVVVAAIAAIATGIATTFPGVRAVIRGVVEDITSFFKNLVDVAAAIPKLIGEALSGISLPSGLKGFLSELAHDAAVAAQTIGSAFSALGAIIGGFLLDLAKFATIGAVVVAAAGAIGLALSGLGTVIGVVTAAFAALSVEGIVAAFASLWQSVQIGITQLALLGEAAIGVRTPLAAMTTAALAVGAAFVGWEIGKVLYNNIPAVKAFGDALSELVSKTPLINQLFAALSGLSAATEKVNQANTQLLQTVEQLKAKLAAHNVVIQQGNMSLEEYSSELRKAALGLKDNATAAVDYGNTLTALNIKHAQLAKALKDAQVEYNNVNKAFKLGAASAADLKEAHDKLTAAIKAAHPEWTATGIEVTKVKAAHEALNPVLAAAESVIKSVSVTLATAATTYGEFVRQVNKPVAFSKDLTEGAKEIEKLQAQLAKLIAAWPLLTEAEKATAAQLANLIEQYKVWEARLAQNEMAKAFDDLTHSLDALGPRINDVFASIEQSTLLAGDHIRAAAGAMEYLGLTTEAAYKDKVVRAEAAYKKISSLTQQEMQIAKISYHDQLAAWVAMQDEKLYVNQQTGEKIYNVDVKQLDKAKAYLKSSVEETKSIWKDLAKAVEDVWGQAVDAMGKALGKGFADAIFQSKSFGDFLSNVAKAITQAFQKMAEQVLEAIFTQLIQKGFAALKSSLSELAGAFDGVGQAAKDAFGIPGAAGALGGGGGGLPIPGLPGGGGGGGGAAGAAAGGGGLLSGILGIATAIGAVVSAVTGIISVIQASHTNRVLGQIETSTRYMEKGMNGGDGLNDNLKQARETLQNIRDRIVDLWVAFSQVEDVIRENFQSLWHSLDTVTNVLLGKMESWLAQIAGATGRHDSFFGQDAGSGAAAAASGQSGQSGPTTIYLTVQAAPEVRTIAEEIVHELGLMGVKLT